MDTDQLVADATNQVNSFIQKQKERFNEFDVKQVEFRGRLRDIEQKLARRSSASGDGGGIGNESAFRQVMDDHGAELKALSSGQSKSMRFNIPASTFNLKTAILGPIDAGDAALQLPDRSPVIAAPAMQRLTVMALLPSLPTTAGATSYTRQNVFFNAAAIQGADGSPMQKEGQLKAESGFGFELVVAPIQTIAHWIPMSDQVLEDMPALMQHVETWLRYGLALKAEHEILNGSGTGLHLQGLTSIATPYNRGGTNDTFADAIRKSFTQLALANHTATGVIVNPVDSEKLDLLKDSMGRYLRVVVNGLVWNVPLIESNSMAAGTFLSADFRGAQIRTRQDATLELSRSHLDFFARNLVAALVELRIGLEIQQPAGFVLGSTDFSG
jgi:HK97 family phage major capsid protein